MNLNEADTMARTELAKWTAKYPERLAGWKFVWNNRKTSFGMCRYWAKEIQLSKVLTASAGDPAHVVDTIRHEIAHALAGARAGHGSVWKMWARTVGAIPVACSRMSAGSIPVIAAWQICVVLDGKVKVLGHYHKRPNSERVKRLIMKGRPDTFGKLFIRPTPQEIIRENRIQLREAAKKAT